MVQLGPDRRRGDNLRTAFVRLVGQGDLQMWFGGHLCYVTPCSGPPERCFPRTDIFHFKSALAPAFVWWKGWDLWRETLRDAGQSSRSSAAETTPLRGKGWDTLPIMGWTLHGPAGIFSGLQGIYAQRVWKGMHLNRQLPSILLCLSESPGHWHLLPSVPKARSLQLVLPGLESQFCGLLPVCFCTSYF